MADVRISDLVTASQLKDDDYYEISQSESGTRVSYKTTLLAIAVQIATMVDFTSDLNTTSKKITGAINELKQLISLIPQFSIEVVEELPTEDISDTTIYLVPAEDPEVGNYYEEYIHVNNTWELVGTTAVDLSAYYTKLEVDGLLVDKLEADDFEANQTASANPITLETKQAGLAKSCVVEMNPIQSGTGDPSPSNIRPITGRTEASVNQGSVDITTLYNGQIQSTGSFSWNNNRISNVNSSQMNTHFLKKGTHTLTFNKLNQSAPDLVECTVMTKNDNFEIVDNFATAWHSLPYTFELTADAYVYFTARKDYGTTLNTADYKTLIIDEIHTKEFGQTVYGGTLDAATGLLTITNTIKNLGELTWTKNEHQTLGTYFYATVTSLGIKYEGAFTSQYHAITTEYKVTGRTPTLFLNNTFCFDGSTNNVSQIQIKDDRYSDATTFKNGLTTDSVQLCYELATPTTIQLSPEALTLLKGLNVISTDGDKVQVEFSDIPVGDYSVLLDYVKSLEARIQNLES